MSKRFVISINDGTASIRDAITFLLREKGMLTWHWINDLWLVVSPEADIKLIELRNEILGVYRGHFILFDVDTTKDWSAVGPGEMGDWLTTNWQ